MIIANDAPKRPALRYFGSKFSLASWIGSYMPPHEHKVIPFAGSLSDLILWPRVRIETANDLDGRVINFFRVLRDNTDELIGALELTPWHEGEYELCKVPAPVPDPVEDARRFFMLCWASIQGGPNPTSSSFRWVKRRWSRWTTPASDMISLVDNLFLVAERLRYVQFLQRDALELIDSFTDIESVLIYADPPYMMDTGRVTPNAYLMDTSDSLHSDLADLLNRHSGFAMVCGYASDEYQRLYPDWTRIDKEARVNNGGSKTESLWLSPRTHQALFDTYSDMPLFNTAG